ncbi:uncharacterized mitochondrial protein AtMg00810-like [Dioscorea cayenensis subsp. rotundata]|uniref:Uncharacterized mitochondrial protein AtMg00810-like n=1 Tax=Dioscorea cayennensis subsp. rotundata TaxID=55577 RepID=A0AB40ASW6_DIOCR|nr:uncharacterized mitochondrial protein AtMg00810-like [Dioscorea cayenensis subsp. rotundata]
MEEEVYVSPNLEDLKYKAPRAWYERLDTWFLSQGFHKSLTKHTLYKKSNKQFETLLVCVYVDDLICLGSAIEAVDQFKEAMKKEFDITYLGVMKYFLGLEVHQSGNGIHVSQKKYAKDLLRQFGMQNCKSVGVPMAQSTKLQLSDDAKSVDATMYRSLIGKLLYLTHTMPDLVYSVNLLSRHMAQPTKFQLGVAKHVLRYVAGTYDYGIQYNSNVDCVLEGYCDSDWSGDTQDRKSTSSFVLSLGFGAVCWSSKRQEIVALSSIEAEYIALNATCYHSIWMEKILVDCNVNCDAAVQI